ISTGPKLVTVEADVLRGSTGTSPIPAALVTWIVPAGALSVAPGAVIGDGAVDTGPPTSASVPGTGPKLPPFTVVRSGSWGQKPERHRRGGAQGAAVGVGRLKLRPVRHLQIIGGRGVKAARNVHGRVRSKDDPARIDQIEVRARNIGLDPSVDRRKIA